MQQLTINLPPDLYAFVERSARNETRPIALQVRHFIAEAAKRAGHKPELTAWPPELPTVTPENLPFIKAAIATMQAEYDRLRAIERKTPTGLLPHEDERLRYARDRIDQLNRQVKPLEAALGGRK